MKRVKSNFNELLVLLIVLIFISCNSHKNAVVIKQNPIVYYDIDHNQVSESEFKSLINYAYNIDVYEYGDSITEASIVIRFEEGKLTRQQLDAFKASIEDSEASNS